MSGQGSGTRRAASGAGWSAGERRHPTPSRTTSVAAVSLVAEAQALAAAISPESAQLLALSAGVGELLAGALRVEPPEEDRTCGAVGDLVVACVRAGVAIDDIIDVVCAVRGRAWACAHYEARREGGHSGSAASARLGRLLRALEETERALARGVDEAARSAGEGRRETRSHLLRELLAGAAQEMRMVQRARAFSIDLRHACGLLVITPSGCDKVAVVEAAVRRVTGNDGWPHVLFVGEDVPHAVVLVVGEAAWADAVAVIPGVSRREHVHALVVDPVTGVAAIRQAYRRAARMLSVVATVFRSARVATLDGLLVYEVLGSAGEEQRRALVETTLGGVLSQQPDSRDVLMRTLAALLDAEGHGATAAAVLGVHANTVRYRVERIHDLTGLRYDRPAQRLRLDLAVMVLRLAGSPLSAL